MTYRVQPRHAAPNVPLRSRLLHPLRPHRRRLVAAAIAGLGVAALLGSAVPAGAASPSHDPYGYLDTATGGPGGTILVSGWAVDPDAPTTSLTIVYTIDGARNSAQVANVDRPDVAAAKHSGLRVGFRITLVATPGKHTVCALIRNVGAGASTTAGCATSSVPAPSAAELAHYPTGRLESAAVAGNKVTVKGWAAGPGCGNHAAAHHGQCRQCRRRAERPGDRSLAPT